MSPRARLVLAVVGLIALCATALAAIAASSQDPEPVVVLGDGAQAPFEGAVRPQAPPSSWALRDQDGELVRVSELRGSVVVLSPTYSTCEESCPIAAQQIRGALDDLTEDQRAHVRAFALSVDPEQDTPQRAQEFLLSRRVRGYLEYLLGSRRELQPVWREYGLAPQTAEREHNSHVVVLDRSGRARVGFPVEHLTPEALTHDLRVLLRER